VDEGVAVKRVADEFEADLVCGLLRSAGIECAHRPTDDIDSTYDNFFGDAGPHEVIVHPDDLEAARELLADAESAGDELPEEEPA
jgi:hypothetical protein